MQKDDWQGYRAQQAVAQYKLISELSLFKPLIYKSDDCYEKTIKNGRLDET